MDTEPFSAINIEKESESISDEMDFIPSENVLKMVEKRQKDARSAFLNQAEKLLKAHLRILEYHAIARSVRVESVKDNGAVIYLNMFIPEKTIPEEQLVEIPVFAKLMDVSDNDLFKKDVKPEYRYRYMIDPCEIPSTYLTSLLTITDGIYAETDKPELIGNIIHYEFINDSLEKKSRYLYMQNKIDSTISKLKECGVQVKCAYKKNGLYILKKVTDHFGYRFLKANKGRETNQFMYEEQLFSYDHDGFSKLLAYII